MPAPPPTARLLRAVAAERDELDRHRARMTEEADELRRALARIERGLVDIDERRALLDRLTAEPDTHATVARRAAPRTSGNGRARSNAVVRSDADVRSDGGVRSDTGARGDSEGRGDAGARGDADLRGDSEARGNADVCGDGEGRGDGGVRTDTGARGDSEGRGDAGARGDADVRGDVGDDDALLRGPEIRAAAVRVLLERGGEAMHYRDWYALVEARGLEVAGKDPLAVFLTQLGRSPAVRRGMEAGVYELDRHAGARHRAKLEGLQRELRELTMAAGGDLQAIRARRQQLSVEIGRVERSLEEIARVLGPAPPLAAAG
jgi:hypothetical protein